MVATVLRGPRVDWNKPRDIDGAFRIGMTQNLMSSSSEDGAARRRYRPIPARKQLPHDIPLWVDPTREVYFITVCCAERGRNQLTETTIARALLESIRHRDQNGHWFATLALLMPDHVHLLVSFPNPEKVLRAVMSKWKEWNAKRAGIKWQRDFFEHRLRKEESVREKADYILANPIRAGLATDTTPWPFVHFGEG